MRRKRAAFVGVALVGLIVAGALVAPWVAPHPDRGDLGAVLEAPSSVHWMGTDGNGRDVFSRLLHGARVSLTVGFTAAALSLLVGLPAGAAAGWRGGLPDAVVGRVIETAMCFPAIVVTVALLSTDPAWLRALPETLKIAIALAVVGWTPAARYLRAEFQRLRGGDAVLAARAAGAGELRIVLVHLLPRSLAPVLVTLSFAVGASSLAEATLSFLGVGIAPPTASWGEMLFQAQHHVGRAWWLALFPGLSLFTLVLGCNRLAEGIRDWMDPQSRLV
ncbi:MAG TPA: ABC transporter permease [Candidatus Polarisedimenticolaceae bacterium]|nr:ABC transporter permease [Candidatus Polarisedimenticolaceae bacterium]